ncbi:hypothetical protein SISNIDRAFT_356495 [Sistotremastrum niveocremeum HHB9708]|uniref:F-box domain-containing protein n=1 Tax=Sistotremastrum niveocremeum HHB9708 TaxID=1314777 RepID=A0A164WJ32_9AGAM|nr:hypothetical protein SISNIDRAFT_356495 [Sistotremastrum niveocremeum HHB9708]
MNKLTAVETAWHLHEIVDIILGYSLPKELASCARVSHFVSSHALDLLYRNVCGLTDILHLLAPTESQTVEWTTNIVFTRPIQPDDWERFLPYARRVRHLTHVESVLSDDEPVLTTVFQELQNTHPTGVIFPFLQSAEFRMQDDMRFMLMFTHERLRRLSIASDARFLKDVLRGIPKASPGLEFLKVTCSDAIQTTVSDLVALAEDLPNLREIILSSHLLCAVVISSLSKHPHITTISQDSSGITVLKHPGIHYERRISDTDFQSLKSLHLDTDMDSLLPWLSNRDVLPSLRVFGVELRTLEPPHRIRDLFTLLTTAIPHIVELTVDSYKHNRRSTGRPLYVSSASFQPLTQHLSLTCFVFDHPDPLCMNDEDVESLAKAWPNLTTFYLGKSALYKDAQAVLSMSVLSSFAQHCPKLQTLALVMNALTVPSPSPSNQAQFGHNFKQLDVGCSPISDPRAVANFLSRVVPEGTELLFWHTGMPNSTAAGSMFESLMNRHENWKAASIWLMALHCAHSENKTDKLALSSVTERFNESEQENMRLRREVEMLRMANSCSCTICSRTRHPSGHGDLFLASKLPWSVGYP